MIITSRNNLQSCVQRFLQTATQINYELYPLFS